MFKMGYDMIYSKQTQLYMMHCDTIRSVESTKMHTTCTLQNLKCVWRVTFLVHTKTSNVLTFCHNLIIYVHTRI